MLRGVAVSESVRYFQYIAKNVVGFTEHIQDLVTHSRVDSDRHSIRRSHSPDRILLLVRILGADDGQWLHLILDCKSGPGGEFLNSFRSMKLILTIL